MKPIEKCGIIPYHEKNNVAFIEIKSDKTSNNIFTVDNDGRKKAVITLMDMTNVKMPKACIKDMKKEMQKCWDTMTENSMELKMSFSVLDVMIAMTAIIVTVVGIIMIKRACMEHNLLCRVKKSAE